MANGGQIPGVQSRDLEGLKSLLLHEGRNREGEHMHGVISGYGPALIPCQHSPEPRALSRCPSLCWEHPMYLKDIPPTTTALHSIDWCASTCYRFALAPSEPPSPAPQSHVKPHSHPHKCRGDGVGDTTDQHEPHWCYPTQQNMHISHLGAGGSPGSAHSSRLQSQYVSHKSQQLHPWGAGCGGLLPLSQAAAAPAPPHSDRWW